jgi:hypothetical protein
MPRGPPRHRPRALRITTTLNASAGPSTDRQPGLQLERLIRYVRPRADRRSAAGTAASCLRRRRPRGRPGPIRPIRRPAGWVTTTPVCRRFGIGPDQCSIRGHHDAFRVPPPPARPPRIPPATRESSSHAGFRRRKWRDPDSNRGHHDFQTGVPNTRTRAESPANEPVSAERAEPQVSRK